MDPQHLYIENFMSHRRTSIDCTQFQTALIVGKSKNNPRESNGVGKTTIFHAIEYVLHGTFPTSIIDNIVRDGCDSCKVIYDFMMGPTTYRIERIRSRKSKRSYLYFKQKRGKTWKDPIKLTQKTPTETQAEIIKIIKINSKAFTNSVLFAQSDLEGLASARPNERRGILKEALSLEVYNKFEKIAKQERDKVSKKIGEKKAVCTSLGDPATAIAEIETKLEANKALLNSKEAERDAARHLLSEKKALLADIKHLVSSEVSSLNDKLAGINASKTEITDKIDKQQRKLASKVEEVKRWETNVDGKRQVLKRFNDLLDEAYGLSFRALDKISNDLQAASTSETNSKVFIGSLRVKIRELSNPLPEGDICPHCRQTMSHEHRENCIKLIEEELVKLNSELRINVQRLTSCTNKKDKLAKELRDANAHAAKISQISLQIETKFSELEHAENYLKQINELKLQATSDLELNEKRLIDLEAREVELKKTIDKLAVDDINTRIVRLNVEIDSIENVLKELLKEISSSNTLEGILTERKNSKTGDLNKLNSLNSELSKLEREYAIRQRVMKGFSSSGIPTMVIHTILDDLQLESNRLLSDLKPGLELQFSVVKDNDGAMEDTLDMMFRVHGREREYQQLSGGQKLLFALSLKLGLSLIIQKRLGVDIKFLELDEVDAMLDKSAVDAFADVIKKWQQYFKILVITHNDLLKDKFEHAILVEGDENNGSTARLVNSW